MATTTKTAHITITFMQKDGERVKSLARNVVMQADGGA